MDFGTNKTPIETIKEVSSDGTYFRDIYPGVNDKFYRDSWKEFNVDQKIYRQILLHWGYELKESDL